MMTQLEYVVDGMSCNSCRLNIIEELEELAGVRSVDVDLDGKRVRVEGDELTDEQVRAAISQAGYEAVPAGGGER